MSRHCVTLDLQATQPRVSLLTSHPSERCPAWARKIGACLSYLLTKKTIHHVASTANCLRAATSLASNNCFNWRFGSTDRRGSEKAKMLPKPAPRFGPTRMKLREAGRII